MQYPSHKGGVRGLLFHLSPHTLQHLAFYIMRRLKFFLVAACDENRCPKEIKDGRKVYYNRDLIRASVCDYVRNRAIDTHKTLRIVISSDN